MSTIDTFGLSMFETGIKVLFRSVSLKSLQNLFKNPPNSHVLMAGVSKYQEFLFSTVCGVVRKMAGARLLRQYLLPGLSCAVIKIQFVSAKVLTTQMSFRFFGKKIHQEVIGVYFEIWKPLKSFSFSSHCSLGDVVAQIQGW